MTIVAAVDPRPPPTGWWNGRSEMAQKLDAELHVVHVFQPPSTVYPMQGMYLIDDEEMEKAEHELVWNQLEDLLTDDSIRRAELRGYPATAIVEYAGAERRRDDRHRHPRRGGFASLVLGSDQPSGHHDAHCDVLVVKTSGQNS